jgi:hypothetical protein
MNQKTKNEQIVQDIVFFLVKNCLWSDVCIYYNNQRLSPEYGLETNINALDYVEYANTDTVTMTFEGDLYNVLNGYSGYDIYKQFEELVHKHGYYFEIGYHWSLSLYPLSEQF